METRERSGMTLERRSTAAMRFVSALAVGAVLAAASSAVGEIYVLRQNDGTAFTNDGRDAVPVFIDHFNDDGTTAGASIALPTAASDSHHALTLAPESTSSGHLSRSTDGQYLLLGGYAAVPGTEDLRATSAGTIPRVIGRIRLSDGNVDTSTGLTDAYSGGTTNADFRSVVSTDGTKFWTFGTGSSSGVSGARYVASVGVSTSTQLSSTPTNVRIGRIFDGQLYETNATGANIGVNSIGTGLPTAGGQATTLVVPTAGGSSPYGFWFKDSTTVYVADDRASSGGGGIQKWINKADGDYNGNLEVDAADYAIWREQNGQSGIGLAADGDGSGTVDVADYDYWIERFGNSSNGWTLAYTLNTGLQSTDGIRGLDGTIEGDNVVLYATTGTAGFGSNQPLFANSLVKITDTGASSAFSTLATSGANKIFRGVVYVPPSAEGSRLALTVVPEPAGVLLFAIGVAALNLRRRW